MSDPDHGIEDDELPPEPAETITVDAGSRPAARKREKKARRLEREGAEFWRGVLASAIGRREIYGILAACHTFETRFAAGPTGFPDPLATWFQAGEKATGERLHLSLLRIDPNAVLTMMLEHDPRLHKTNMRIETDD